MQKDSWHRSGTEIFINCQIVYGKKLMAISVVGMLLLEETFSVYWKVFREESLLSRASHGKLAERAVGTSERWHVCKVCVRPSMTPWALNTGKQIDRQTHKQALGSIL